MDKKREESEGLLSEGKLSTNTLCRSLVHNYKLWVLFVCLFVHVARPLAMG